MTEQKSVAAHYGAENMVEHVLGALKSEGINIEALSWDQLAAIDQFHTRGLSASREQAELASPGAGEKVIDIGCGAGGPARFLAAEFGCAVTGVDLTPEYVELASKLTELCGLSGTNSFRIADAAALPFDDATFDLGWSQNVSMNVADKTAFYRNIYRVLRPGGRFVTSDVVTGVGGEPAWPLPWARDPSISFVSTPHEMRSSMEEVGFRITAWLDTTSNAVSVFQNPNQQARRGKLGVGLIAGPDFGERSGNLARGMADGIFASVLVRAEKD